MMSISLDGYFEGLDRGLEWQLIDGELHAHFNSWLRDAAAFLEGRVTWEMMAAYWPTADANPDESPEVREFAPIWRDKPKYVFSRTLQQAGWNTTILREVDAYQLTGLGFVGPTGIEDFSNRRKRFRRDFEEAFGRESPHELTDRLRIAAVGIE